MPFLKTTVGTEAGDGNESIGRHKEKEDKTSRGKQKQQIQLVAATTTNYPKKKTVSETNFKRTKNPCGNTDGVGKTSENSAVNAMSMLTINPGSTSLEITKSW